MNPEQLFEQCCSKIDSAYVQLGHTLGWRFLTGPQSAFVAHPKVALVTLQPSGSHDYPEHPRRSSEGGSAYIIESWDGLPAGADPLQRQIRMLFVALASRVGARSGDALLTESLTAHFVPFRSPTFAALPNKSASLAFSESLWATIFEFIHPKVVVVLDEKAFKTISRLLEKTLVQSPSIDAMPIGWGSYVARVRDFSNGPTLCWFPHLSRFQIFGRAASRRPVGEILDVLSKKLQ